MGLLRSISAEQLVGYWIKVYPEEAARFIVLASSNVAVIVLQGVGHYYSNGRKESQRQHGIGIRLC